MMGKRQQQQKQENCNPWCSINTKSVRNKSAAVEANKDYVSAVLELRQLWMGYPVKKVRS